MTVPRSPEPTRAQPAKRSALDAAREAFKNRLAEGDARPEETRGKRKPGAR